VDRKIGSDSLPIKESLIKEGKKDRGASYIRASIKTSIKLSIMENEDETVFDEKGNGRKREKTEEGKITQEIKQIEEGNTKE
jgi:hypothetical protein